MYAWNQNNTYQKSPPPSAPQQPPLPLSYGQQVPPQYGQYVTGVPVVQSTSPASWSTGLCDCLDDVPNCCLTFWCPCIIFGQIAEILDRRTTSCGVHGPLYTLIALLTGCECIYSCTYRSEMRQQYKLPESLCNDICLHCCCHPCALYQEYIELKNREFDMDIGWQGNMERQNQGIVMPPMAPGGMTCLIGEITVND